MKFAEHLSAHITPEWRKQYILYEVAFGNYDSLLVRRSWCPSEEAPTSYLNESCATVRFHVVYFLREMNDRRLMRWWIEKMIGLIWSTCKVLKHNVSLPANDEYSDKIRTVRDDDLTAVYLLNINLTNCHLISMMLPIMPSRHKMNDSLLNASLRVQAYRTDV